jgi:predicted O-methyltransferase YrrM
MNNIENAGEQNKMKLGFNTRGTEQVFEQMLDKADADADADVDAENRTTAFKYLEIGVAEGTTMRAVADHFGPRANLFGVEIEGSPYFNLYPFLEKFQNDNVVVHRSQIRPEYYPNVRVNISLTRGDRRILFRRDSFDFVLIDGCHGSPCVQKDFLSIERTVLAGGIVAFHDAGVEDQGIHFQTHCNQPISVRHALSALWLLDDQRPGWRIVGEVAGDKSPGNPQDNGHGFLFVQRVG